jgi:ATP-binding cassette subfamily F protein 3
MEKISEVVDDNIAVNFKFKIGKQSGRDVVVIENASKAYGDLVILENSTARIERGDKIALIGANGKGKSTLLRIVDGTESFDGSRTEGYNVVKSFYAQHQLEALNVNNEILQEMVQAGSDKSETELRGVLGCFLFSNEDVYKKIKVLSGGEKSRVALAKTLISEANFLLLDEPTNHLDMQSVNILIQALQQYEGTFITVSHDRHFIKGVANKIWYIENQEIKEYLGTYTEYMDWRSRQVVQNEVYSPAKTKNITEKKKPQDFSVIEKNAKEVKRKEQQLVLIEEDITKIELEKKRLEEEMADPQVYQDLNLLEKKNQAYQKVKEKEQSLQEAWEALVEEIGQLQNGEYVQN